MLILLYVQMECSCAQAKYWQIISQFLSNKYVVNAITIEEKSHSFHLIFIVMSQR